MLLMKSHLVSLLSDGSLDLAIQYFVSCLEKPEHHDELDSSFEEIVSSFVFVVDEFAEVEIELLNMLPEPWRARLGDALRKQFARNAWLEDLKEVSAYQKRRITSDERDKIIASVLTNYPQYGGFLESFVAMNRLVKNRTVRQNNLHLMLKHTLIGGNFEDINTIVGELKKLRPAASTVAILDIVTEYISERKKIDTL